jgi:hypothetical protein
MVRRDTISDFIRKARAKHGLRYMYDDVVYINSHTKISIGCTAHGNFEQAPRDHLKGRGCLKCANDERRMGLPDFLIEARRKHGNRYDYHKFAYHTLYTNGIIVCAEHGDFLQKPAKHLMGGNCPKCPAPSRALTTEIFIQRGTKKHCGKYSYPRSIYKNIHSKVIITCTEHGDFSQTAKDHLNGSGCAKCVGTAPLTTGIFINRATARHLGRYTYLRSNYTGTKKKIIITCAEHGDFQRTVEDHLDGYGCSKCSGRETLTTEGFIERAKANHNDRYTYSRSRYESSYHKVVITCPQHGDFQQLASAHLKGQGCIKCAGVETLTTEVFIQKAIVVHSGRYSYERSDCAGSKKNIIITCSRHGDFSQEAGTHLRGSGCPKCFQRFSRPETEFLDLIKIPESKRQIRISGTLYTADGLDETTDPPTIYEFDGDFFHGNPKLYDPNALNMVTKCTFGELYNKTLKKRDDLTYLGYNVVSIWNSELKDFTAEWRLEHNIHSGENANKI